ncbi:MAG TPA: phage major capsid protein [Acidothermaceae bacterium]|nr:phage major capsid protein [Acidothermaceae bacterium]
MLKKLRARVAEINARIREINDGAEQQQRTSLTAEETTEYQTLAAERTEVEARIAQLQDEETRRQADADAATRAGVVVDPAGQPVATIGYEPTTYGRGSGQSYFLDLARAQLQSDPEARDRLQRHAQEVEKEMPLREARRAQRAAQQLAQVGREGLRSRDRREAFFEQRANPNRTDGQGGYFVPPLWLIDEYVPFLRNGRPFAELCRQFELPAGTDSINVPKVLTGTATGVQQDNGAVTSVDLTDTFVTAPVRTIAGQQDIAIQLLDQSPVAFDEIVFQDLVDDYNLRVDAQALSGTGSGGQLKGLDNVSGTNTVTFTSGSPTLALLFPILGQALSQVAKSRKRVATHLLLQGTRWYWMASSLDSQNRPLVVPFAGGPAFNQVADAGEPVAEGPVANILGATAVIDQNITLVDGAGANQDRVYGTRPQDYYLWESSPRMRVLQEVLSGTLQVRLQLWNYVAFMPDRYPTATSIVVGTGLTAPAGF